MIRLDSKLFWMAYGKEPAKISDDVFLDGFWAILRPGKPPLAACGRLLDDTGRELVADLE